MSLLNLPSEIREEIYKHALTWEDEIDIDEGPAVELKSLALCSRLISQESRFVYYHYNDFMVGTDHDHREETIWQRLKVFLENIGGDNRRLIRSLRVFAKDLTRWQVVAEDPLRAATYLLQGETTVDLITYRHRKHLKRFFLSPFLRQVVRLLCESGSSAKIQILLLRHPIDIVRTIYPATPHPFEGDYTDSTAIPRALAQMLTLDNAEFGTKVDVTWQVMTMWPQLAESRASIEKCGWEVAQARNLTATIEEWYFRWKGFPEDTAEEKLETCQDILLTSLYSMND